MDKKVVCIVELFSTAVIRFPDGSSENVPCGQLTKFLLPTCYSEGINKVHFIGNENYISGIIEEFSAAAAQQYGENTIEIEVN